ncbi:hypothetical protein Tco_0682978 [Tanacetum coccineum]|uniref:Uncharacterized protein n=1 Tax=Tanacetum coccineum TaxID=301880 RepID=A0ABQ4XSR7_9ASTR
MEEQSRMKRVEIEENREENELMLELELSIGGIFGKSNNTIQGGRGVCRKRDEKVNKMVGSGSCGSISNELLQSEIVGENDDVLEIEHTLNKDPDPKNPIEGKEESWLVLISSLLACSRELSRSSSGLVGTAFSRVQNEYSWIMVWAIILFIKEYKENFLIIFWSDAFLWTDNGSMLQRFCLCQNAQTNIVAIKSNVDLTVYTTKALQIAVIPRCQASASGFLSIRYPHHFVFYRRSIMGLNKSTLGLVSAVSRGYATRVDFFMSMRLRIVQGSQGTFDLGLHLYASSTTSLVGYYLIADWAGLSLHAGLPQCEAEIPGTVDHL